MSTTDKHSHGIEPLLEGIRKFHREVYSPKRELYEESVRKPQQPHTLLITCADSRIDPEALTQSGPGEIFVTRNIGNLVPAYGVALGAVSAVIEYAVNALGVQNIVVCGHTDCGAMKGLQHLEKVASMPTVSTWLRYSEAALSVVRAKGAGDEKAELQQLIEENVLLQLNHLRTHPAVAGAIAQGKLSLYGWVYDIGHGNVLAYDETTKHFSPVYKD